MRKILILTLVILISFFYGQEIRTDIKDIVPPSPSVSSLMKFEEIPVSNYTGIPDVSIPLMTLPTISKDLSINLSLKYHPSSVAADEVSSDVGLGWNFIHGGSVARTVRGHADESEDTDDKPESKKRIGIYHTDLNTFYQFSDNVLNTSKTYYKPNLNPTLYNLGNKFIWTASRTGIFDTEHDIWQFNFMGNTGRFYIKKNLGQNTLEVVPLDKYIVKIIHNYNPTTYAPEGFIIYDDKGFKYIFNVAETTHHYGSTKTFTYKNNGDDPQLVDSDNLYDNGTFISSFHLSQVFDNNNQEIISFLYQDRSLANGPDSYIESRVMSNITRHEYTIGSISNYYKYFNYCDDLPPVEVRSNFNTNVQVKKVKTINIINHAKVEFQFLQGRLDSNIQLKERTPYLKSVTIKDWYGKQIKKFNFTQDYSEVLHNRMFLKKIEEFDSQNSLVGDYQLNYKEFLNTGGYVPGKDRWGFFNLQGCDAQADKRTTTPNFCDTNILQKIKYPTGGSAVFEYESNQFSFIGDQPIPNTPENISYNFSNSRTLYFTPTNNSYYFHVSNVNRKVTFYPNIVDSQAVNIALILSKQDSSGNWIPVGNISCPAVDPYCCINIILEKGVAYKLLWNDFTIPNHSSTGAITFDVFDEAGNSKFMYGGGIRIKKISYFDQNISVSNYLATPNLFTPSKQKEFSYQLNGSTDYSSGSLVGPIPQFEYHLPFNTQILFAPYGGAAVCNGVGNEVSHSAILSSSDSNFAILQTHGGNVGYKNVIVNEKEKGKILYTYTNPTDYFADFSNFGGPPFVKPKDYDFKRGLLTDETAFNNTGNKLYERTNTYSFQENEEYLGIKFIKPSNVYNGSSPNYASHYSEYLSLLTTTCLPCDSNHTTPINFLGGLPLDINTPNYIPVPIFETYGWAKLTSTQTKNYFYENGNQKVVETLENFAYNNLNKRIDEHTVTHEDGNSIKTKYYYDTGNNSVYSQNRISEIKKIETFENNELINTKEIDYSNSWVGNASFLPQSIKDSHSGTALQTEVVFNHYDDKGNLVQYTTKEGIPVTIIWGYNKTQPIAKIEGIDLEGIPQSMIDTIVQYSITDASQGTVASENNLIAQLDIFRQQFDALPSRNAQITTYSYDPLIGVTSITPPSGIREIYKYDTANRLEKIVDEEGKILKEYQYNYKP